MLEVKKEFMTVNRRFKAGDAVSAEDCADDVMSLEDRIKGGFIGRGARARRDGPAAAGGDAPERAAGSRDT